MKAVCLFFTLFVFEFILVLNASGQNYDYYPLKEFKGDTVAFYKKNFWSCMRYEDKNFNTFFEDFEKDLPIRTAIFFLDLSGESVTNIFFFAEPKEKVEAELKKNGRYYGIATNIRYLLYKNNDPAFFYKIASWGFGKFLDMTDEIREEMHDKEVGGIWYDFLDLNYYLRHRDEKPK